MCGICGIIDWKNSLSVDERHQRVAAMNQAILHRGPDDEGFLSRENASLAMRRLSIIDEEGGSQPIFNETKDICIFFNGEIYNFPILKKDLQEKGHQFITHSINVNYPLHIISFSNIHNKIFLCLVCLGLFCIP